MKIPNKSFLEPFIECTERVAHQGNWEIIRKKSRRKTNNLLYKRYLATSDIARRSSEKNINFSLLGLRQGNGNLIEINFTATVRQLSSCCGLSEVYKEMGKATVLKTHEML